MNQINKFLLNYNTHNINKCSIYLGSIEIKNKNILVFNKNILDYTNYLNIISTLNYKHNSYKSQILNYNHHYLNKSKNSHYKFTNINHNIIDDNKLIITYQETIQPIHDFSCKQNYNILNQSIHEFIVNNEITLIFTDNSIKIDIIVNHNIDNTLKFLPKILSYFN